MVQNQYQDPQIDTRVCQLDYRSYSHVTTFYIIKHYGWVSGWEGGSLADSLVKNMPGNAGDMSSFPEPGKTPWRRAWQPTPGFLPGESHGQRSLADYGLWGHTKSDTSEGSEHTQANVCLCRRINLGFCLRFQ